MKKLNAFILVIGLALSIVIITFFGQSVSMDQFKVMLTYITITNYDIDIYDRLKSKYLIYQFDINIDNTIRIEYDQGPTNATEYNSLPNFTLVGDEGSNSDGTTFKKAIINKFGELTLLNCYKDEPSSVKVIVETSDGSRIQDSIQVNWIMKK